MATERANLLFSKIANDEELILAKANPGSGSVVEEDSNSTSEEPETPENALPDSAQGTTAATKSCSK